MNDELIKELAEEQLGDDPFYSKPCEEAIKKALKIERESFIKIVEKLKMDLYLLQGMRVEQAKIHAKVRADEIAVLIRNGEY